MLSLVQPIQLEVISYLDFDEKTSLRVVCKYFKAVIDQNFFLFAFEKKSKTFFKTPPPPLIEEISAIPEIIRERLLKLRLHAEDSLENIFKLVPTSLSTLDLSKSKLSSEIQFPKNLKNLKLSNAILLDCTSFSQCSLTFLNLHLPQMNYDDLRYLPTSLNILFISTDYIPMFHSTHIAALTSLRKLQILSLYTKTTSGGLQYIPDTVTKLRLCQKRRPIDLQIKHLSRLKSLVLRKMKIKGDQLLNIPINVEKLKLRGMPLLGEKDVVLLPRNLKHLVWKPKKTGRFLLNTVVSHLPTTLRSLSIHYIGIQLPINLPTSIKRLSFPFPSSMFRLYSLNDLPRTVTHLEIHTMRMPSIPFHKIPETVSDITIDYYGTIPYSMLLYAKPILSKYIEETNGRVRVRIKVTLEGKQKVIQVNNNFPLISMQQKASEMTGTLTENIKEEVEVDLENL